MIGINDRKQHAEAERTLQRQIAEDADGRGVAFADPARVRHTRHSQSGRDVFIDVNAVFEGDVELGDGVRIGRATWSRDSRLGADSDRALAQPYRRRDDGRGLRDRPVRAPAARRGARNAREDRQLRRGQEERSIGDGSKVNHLTYVGDARWVATCNVGAGTITCNYDGVNKHRTVIGDGAFIGSGVMLVAPVDVGASATIGAGSTITKAAPAGELALERSKQIVASGWKRPQKKEKRR